MKVRIHPGNEECKRHTVDCFVPEMISIRGRYVTIELTPQVREAYEPCLHCGGGGH